MPKILKKQLLPKKRPGPRKYPWNEWFELLKPDHILVLQQGDDFETSPRSLRNQWYAEAAKRDISLTLVIEEDKLLIQRSKKQ